ncbi:hypothetical protein K493DRAFT_348290 [Basidiobolus meristosporus CBS 931.73]|uniref:Uncharacterized protein n=1 Tax=Basidiobolus meristosporus CBS 931.73 TaxID=1314790 RepID=A0A1Y1YPD4_9FUNG|nr:hypothetical protein K493DRAFT_348290 [Basidiobolus meristosporus CBS 931.73]|eukprot:ORX99862.1 hypothetical protein K493DRAFT_348290 [Basidiobolus meristosporus CBS 931.73]
MLVYYFVYDTSCVLRNLITSIANGLLCTLFQVATAIWVYRNLKCKVILAFVVILILVRTAPLTLGLVSAIQYSRIVGLCTLSGPQLLYQSAVFDITSNIIFIMSLNYCLFYQYLPFKPKTTPLSDMSVEDITRMRAALGLFIQCFILAAIVTDTSLYPESSMAITSFHFSLCIACKLITDILYRVLPPFDGPNLDSPDEPAGFIVTDESRKPRESSIKMVPSRQTCCGCINLRVGSLLLTIFQMLLGIIGCGLSIWILLETSRRSPGSRDLLWAGPFVLLIASAIVFTVGMIGVIGIAKSKSTVLLVYLIFNTLSVMCSVGAVVLAFKNGDVPGGVQSVLVALLQVYFFFVILRYRREVKAFKRAHNMVQFRRIESPVV